MPRPAGRGLRAPSALSAQWQPLRWPRSPFPGRTAREYRIGTSSDSASVLSRKTGVIVGDDVLKLFQHAKEEGYAIPAVNVTSSSTVIASLEAARDKKSPIILQTSQGGAAFFAGKGVDNKDQAGSIAGAIAAAHFIRSIAPAYGIPVVL
jgi:hypothetical protein